METLTQYYIDQESCYAGLDQPPRLPTNLPVSISPESRNSERRQWHSPSLIAATRRIRTVRAGDLEVAMKARVKAGG